LPITKILAAVDGSDPSFNASTYAIDLAITFEAELIALHVIDPRYSELEIALSPRPGRYKEIATKVMEKGEQIVDAVKQMATEKNVSVKTDVISGITSVVKDIVEYAENNKIDMIVIGSRGMTGFKKLLLGSVASGVVTYSHCPVLVVK
jgi:nucleotide-binding universal stress UspA family protein